MAVIYEPRGKAREYSPRAINIYRGCAHGCTYCLDRDTLIQMADGTAKPIRDVGIGDSVIGMSFGKILQWRTRFKVTEVLNTKTSPRMAYRIRLEDGTFVICSGDHRWFTSRGWQHTIGGLRAGDTIRAALGSVRVVSVEPMGEARTMYDLTTGTETFLANGLVSHNCYVPRMLKITPDEFRHRGGVNLSWNPATLRRECKAIEGTSIPVFLSFTSDPYPDIEMSEGHTRTALEILLEYHVPAIILTKSGTRSLRDLDLWKRFEGRLKYGATLTTLDIGQWIKWERMSPRGEDRMEALHTAHEAGIKTWASIEPVFDPVESLTMIRETLGYVDEYRVGCISGHPEVYDSIDWHNFTEQAVTMMRDHGKKFYIKQELARVAGVPLTPQESVLALNDSFCGEWKRARATTQGQLIG